MTLTTDPDVRFLQALADPVRLSIVRQIASSGSAVCACDFTSCCTVSQPTVSHHLKVLRDAGAVTSERRGNWVYYQLAPNLQERLGGIAGGLVPGNGLIQVSALRSRAPKSRAPKSRAVATAPSPSASA